ncbi:MAG: molybdopterin dinucleotide binding domain-containing protein [Acidobacteriota bacterium]
MDFDRRDFLKAGGTAAALGVLAGCREREQALLTQPVGRPKVADGWHDWVCTQCPGACAATVRVAQEEAKKIEGRPEGGVGGGLCGLGHSALQEHYDPDRYRQPRLAGTATDWESAMARVAELLAACADPEDLLLVVRDPMLAALAQRVAEGLGSESALLLVEEATAVESAAAQLVLGKSGLPAYRLDGADLIVTWGASVLDAGRSPVHFTESIFERGAETLHVHVGPRLSLTAAKADLWLAPRPGTLGVLAAAVGGGLAEARSSSSPWASDVPSIADAASICDVPLDRIETLAKRLSESEDAVVVAGCEGCGADPVSDLAASLVLNELLGGLASGRVEAREGRAVLPPSIDAAGLQVGTRTELAQRLESAKVAVLVEVDPVPGSAPALGLADLLGSLEGVVAIAGEAMASAETASVLLPSHSSLERLEAGVSEPARDRLLLAKAVLPARYDTQSPASVLLALAAAGGAPVAESYEEVLAEVLAPLLGEEQSSAALRTLRRSFGKSLVLAPTEPTEEPEGLNSRTPLPVPAALEPADGAVLLSFASPKHHEGRGLNRTWLQELPDPLSTVLWQGWVQLSPQDAHAWHVEDGDWVELVRGEVTLSLPAAVLPSVRPGVVEVPRGYGATVGRFAEGRGADVALLLDDAGPLGTVPIEVHRAVEQKPVAFYGRGLGQNEHLPRGWGAQDPAEGHSEAAARVPRAPLRVAQQDGVVMLGRKGVRG